MTADQQTALGLLHPQPAATPEAENSANHANHRNSHESANTPEKRDSRQSLSNGGRASATQSTALSTTLSTKSGGIFGSTKVRSTNRSTDLRDDNAINNYNGPIHIKWRNVSYSVPIGGGIGRKKVEKEVLKGLSGDIRPGELVGIMSKGLEKKALLNILTGRIKEGIPTGLVSINGKQRKVNWLRSFGYVDKQSLLYTHSTVREALSFVAELKLSKKFSKEARSSRVTEIMTFLNILHLADRQIGSPAMGGLSYYERKKVAIGIELVVDSRLLFLDEPLRTLTPYESYDLIGILKKLATVGQRTIVTTVKKADQPVLELFSRILLLCEGETVFFGTYNEITAHLKSCDFKTPTQFISLVDTVTNIVLAGKKHELVYKAPPSLLSINASSERSSTVSIRPPILVSQPIWTASWFTELKCLLVRHYYDQKRDTQTIAYFIGFRFFLTIMFGFLFYNVPGAYDPTDTCKTLLFYISSYLMSLLACSSPNSFMIGISLMKHERHVATYRMSSYYIAKVLALLPLRFVTSVLFTFPVYYICGLRTDGFQHFVVFFFMSLLSTLAAVSLALFVACITDDIAAQFWILNTFITLFTVFSGFIVNVKIIPSSLRWLKYFSVIGYTYQALYDNEFRGTLFDQVSGTIDLEQNEAYVDTVGQCFYVISGYCLLYFIMGFILLSYRSKPRFYLI